VTARFDPERFQALDEAERGGLGLPVTFVNRTGSTNDDAFDAAHGGAPDGALFVSDAQTAGRGRRGNAWLSEPGEGLLFSLLLRRALSAGDAALIPLVTGLAVRAAVAELLDARGLPQAVSVKWPNDVLADGRKLAGILVESRVRGDTPAVTVIGVGLNVGRLVLPPSVGTDATSLAQLGAPDIERETFLHSILSGLARRLRSLGAERATGENAVVAELRRFDALKGRKISVGSTAGVAEGIDEHGSLLIKQADDTVVAVRSGHVAYE